MLLSRLVAAWLRLLLGIVEWLHARTVGPIVDWLDESVLAASEESIKLFVRECFVSAKRLINGFCAHLLGMFDAQYREGLKLTWQQKEAWHSWWREERTSTLNAVLAAQAPAAAAGTADAAHPPARASSFRQRRTVAFSAAATAGSSKAAAGAKAAAAGTAAAGGSSRHPSHIRWQSDTAPQQLDSISSSSSSCLRSPFPSQSRSAFASDGGAAAAAAAATKDPPPATAGANSSSSSWLARAVWWALVGLQGRAKTPALVAAAATGHSTNPLETLPSLPSMSSLVTLPSLGSLNPWGSGGTVNPVEGLFQQQQGSAPLQQQHHLHPASSSSSSAGRQRGHQQQQQQQQQQEEEGVVELSLLQRVRSSIAHKVRCMVTLALLPFVAPVLPGLWLLGWLWGRTKSAGSTAAADAAIADAASVQATGVAPSGLRRSSSANNSGTSGSSARQGWGFRRTSSCGVGGAAAGSAAAAAAAAAQQQEQQQRGGGRVGAPKRPRQQQQQQRGGSAGPMRSIVFEEAAAFGGQESSRRRGLLEELSVTMELLVTAVFEALRWVVRALTLTRRQQHPTAARQRRLAAAAAAAAAAADGDSQHIGGGGSGVADGGLSSSSSGLWFGRRSSSGGGSSSCRSRPGSPVAGVKQGGPHAHSPFGAAAFGGSGSNDDGSAEGSDGGGGAVAGMFRALSPHMDPGEEIGMQASVQQQQRHQHHHRQHSSSMLSSRSSSGGSIGSFYSGVSSSSSRSSSSAGSEVGGEEELLWGVGEAPTGMLRSKSVGGDLAEFRKGTGGGSSALPRLTLRRVRSVGRWNHQSNSTGGGSGSSGRQPWLDDSELTAAAQCIMSAGYPLEIHTVTTADGVVLQMERIPRPGCARVSFFLHGILDTSLTWVSSGVTGSQAFAAWDQGFDVWLGSSRSNAPRISRDPSKKGLRYFSFSLNELGIHDIPAQLDHLHTVKMRELAGSSLRSHGGTAPTPAAAAAAPGPSSSAAAAAAGLRVDVHGLDPWLTSEQQGDPQHAADSEAVFARAAAASPSLQQQQQQAGVCLQQQQQRAAGWFSPLASSSMKRTLSDPNLLPRRGDREGGSPPAAAAPLGQVQELSQGGQEKRRGGVLGAAGRLLRGAVRGGRRQQQQQPQASQPDSQQQQQQWQTAAAVAAVVSAAAASAAATAAVAAATAASGSSSCGGSLPEQQQQVQEGGRPGFRVPLLSQGLGAHPLEVNEPSTPELIESPRRPEDGCSDGGTAAAAAAGAAVAGALSPEQQQQLEGEQQQQQELFQAVQEEEDSPFTAAGEADAAIAAAEAACVPRCSSSGGGSGSNGDGWHSPRQSAVPRLRSTGSYGTAVDSRQQKSRRGQHQQSQQQQTQSPRSCGISSSAPGAPHNQQQQQGGGGASNSSRSTPGAAPRTAAAAGAASAAAATVTEPYDLRVVAHSLGGCSMLVFCVMRAAAGLPHRVRRLVLLSPAGFHDVIPWAWWPFIFVLPYWHKLLVLLLGKERAYHPALLPTYTARGFFFNALLELARLPAMADLARAVMSGFFGGDASQWERALIMPHYSAAGMPACSLHQALHFIQIIHTGRFQLFDYGSPAENMARYGTPRPPDIASQYWRLSNLPVQLMAGSHDGIVPPVNVQKHYRAMSAAGMKVTYRELPYGHMDFTSLAAFSLKDEMRYHVMRALNAHN